MASLIESLITNLEEQSTIYDEVLLLQDPKTEAIVENNLEDVQRVTKRENELAGQIARLERQRATVIEDIALVLNKKVEELTMSKLASLLKEGSKEHADLLGLREKLLQVTTELKNKNKQNEQLIHHALDYIDFTVNALHSSRTMPEGNGYAAGGQSYNSNGTLTNYFDAKQ